MKIWIKYLVLAAMVLLILYNWSPGSRLVPICELDGTFADWRGRVHLSDLQDNSRLGHDFKEISWAINENDSQLYFMIERFPVEPEATPLEGQLFMDINGNGAYADPVDKYAQIAYQPRNQEWGDVYVSLYSMAGELQAKYSGRWGEGLKEGAKRFEFAIPMEDLHLYPGQAMSFYLSDVNNRFDRLPDHGDIQWSPFPLTRKNPSAIALAFLFWLGVTLFFYVNRLWVFYYIWASVGLCCLMVLLFQTSLVEYRLETYTSLLLQKLLAYGGIVTHVFDNAPGTLLVLIKIDTSWTTIAIDIENSGLLEMCIIFSLIIFYPIHHLPKRTGIALIGVLGIYLINFLRIVIVIILIHTWGRNMSFIAHTLFGRLVFFVLVVGLYWQLITKPTLDKIRGDIQND